MRPSPRPDRLDGPPDTGTAADYAGRLLVIPRDNPVTVGGEQVHPGQCALADDIASVEFPQDGCCLIARPV